MEGEGKKEERTGEENGRESIEYRMNSTEYRRKRGEYGITHREEIEEKEERTGRYGLNDPGRGHHHKGTPRDTHRGHTQSRPHLLLLLPVLGTVH